MARELSSNNESHISGTMHKMRHTPAINKPNAMPSSVIEPVPQDVAAGLHRLPGASGLEKPSMKMTKMMRSVEQMPKIEVYESIDNGRKTSGANLRFRKSENP
jgi:hypothetical protein